VRELRGALKVELSTKDQPDSPSLMRIRIRQRAAQVLHTLVNLYMEKHLAVHRPAGLLSLSASRHSSTSKG